MDFEITEAHEGGWVRLVLSGDLDSAAAPILDKRLLALRAQDLSVRLNLSQVQLLDSTGISVLVRALQRAGEGSWGFKIDPDAPAFIRRRLEYLGLSAILGWRSDPPERVRRDETPSV